MSDRWNAATAYEDFMGRWSRPLAARFVEWLELPAGIRWLDVGCGTGALSGAIAAIASPGAILACDSSESFVRYARDACGDRVSLVVCDAGALPVGDGRFESVSSSLALNFFPDPDSAIEGMCRCVAAGGCLSACVWDYADGMELLRRFWKVATALDRGAAAIDERARFPLCRPEALDRLFRRAGLSEVRGDSIEIDMEFPAFEDLWRPLLGGTGPAPSYVATLDEHRRSVLARELERALLPRSSGAIRLRARAWAVRGLAAK
jgi:SAM-dependent methyltransferase